MKLSQNKRVPDPSNRFTDQLTCLTNENSQWETSFFYYQEMYDSLINIKKIIF